MSRRLKKLFRNLRAGQTLYKVYALGMYSVIREIRVVKRVRPHAHASYLHELFNTNEFIMDCNGYIDQHRYNMHKVFKSKRRANKYLAECLRYNYRFR